MVNYWGLVRITSNVTFYNAGIKYKNEATRNAAVLTRFASKSVGSGLGPGSRNCPLAEKREQARNWLNQDAYAKASLFKKIWMCLQYIYWDIRGEKHMPEIPAHLRMEMARCLLPDIIAFCESEKGKAEIAQWKAEREAKKEKGEVA